MERNFTDENFEQFLRQNADGLRMRPTDRVWKGIANDLNKRRRRIGWLLGSFLTGAAILGYLLVDSPEVRPTVSVQDRQHTAYQQPPEQRTSPSGAAEKQTGIIPKKQPIQLTTTLLNTQSVNVLQTVNSGGTETLLTASGESFTPTIVDSYETNSTEATAEQAQVPAWSAATLPMTIESVVNLYKPKNKKKVSFQFYFTPTVSYRKLSENKSYLHSQQVANSANYAIASMYNVNNIVTHKPDMGFELGMAAKYPVSKRVKLRAGVQFNMNRYDIKAYSASTALATIRLNDRSNRGDSLNTLTNYSNLNGYSSNWLENLNFQVSAPFGVEVKLSGDDKVQFGVASTIQPSYLLGERAYLITTDYKNYAQVPGLTRHWNVNTSLETYVSYSTGHLQWQVGPQVRYQLLSSFITKYPVKENLFDFGLKVGISLNK